MALVKCRACGEMVSSSAQACPKCGEPPAVAKFANSLTGTLIGMAIFFAILVAALKVVGAW